MNEMLLQKITMNPIQPMSLIHVSKHDVQSDNIIGQ